MRPRTPDAAAGRAWHALPAAEVVRALRSDVAQGLALAESSRRLLEHGPNRLARGRQASWVRVLFRQFTDVLILILFGAALLSVAIGHVTDALTILAIVLLNGLLGFAQEWRAECALVALRQMLAPRCRVRRDGQVASIDAEELAPGDVVLLAVGDSVPADVRVVESNGLASDEAALTGESVAVAKDVAPVAAAAEVADRSSMAWMGTTVAAGHGVGVVVATGMATAFGLVARLTEGVGSEPTPLQRKLAALGRRLGLLGLGVAVGVALLGGLLGHPWADMVLTGVSLAVAVVPEGLPAVVTLTLALGVHAMARRRALIRRLPAAETLGAATVICTDKTGTLTQSEMTVQQVWTHTGSFTTTGVGYDPAGRYERDGAPVDPQAHGDLLALLATGLTCNSAQVTREDGRWRLRGEATEGALIVAASKAGLRPDERSREAEFPFDSARKRMTVITADEGDRVAHVKGAPEELLQRSTHVLSDGTERPLGAAERHAVTEAFEGMARGGLRTLALARRHLAPDGPDHAEGVEQALTLLGIVGLVDPPRPEVPDAVALARGAGIRVVMITGDAPLTALAVAGELGLGAERAITGGDVESLTDDELAGALAEPVVFARAMPEHKLRIVTILQARGEIVAMTGDGVNDAPALKKADIGIAMGRRGTDVARAAASMVLTDDNFASIVGAIEEGRRQVENIRKFVRYLLSSNTGEMIAILVSVLMGGPLILLPVQILWMNLVTDGPTALALGAERAPRDVMRRPPRAPREPILDRLGLFQVLALGGAIGGLTVLLYAIHDRATAQTIAFTGIIVAEKVNVLNFRVLGAPLRTVGWLSNPWLIAAVAGMLGLQVLAVHAPFLQEALHTVPLTAAHWATVLAVALPVFLVPEGVKILRARRSPA